MSLRKPGSSAGIHLDMTPMVDVMMLLLIFFMMSTTFILVNPGMPVNLPQATTAVPAPVENIMVIIDKDGQMEVSGKRLSLAELTDQLASVAVKQPLVYVKADKDTRHGTVIQVMDAVKKAGIARLSVAVDKNGL